ncbi:ABC-2 transporter permease [Acidicapsa acidisoli]|uniref:ABC-2 transporter permease n=1 Tax=Acidicapsa acidisoli TaxID=1615681 RepID=UPI0021E03346|nr:ABC-2 transporter permease [Acidicapsa acidisoli]
MNWTMVGRLIRKDWYLNRMPILFSIIGGVATLAAMAAMHGSTIAMVLGVIVVVTILVGIGAMVMMSAVVERRQQTLPFVMSLPISFLEYTTAKIVGGLLIFLVLWGAMLAGIVATILLAPGFPHGLIPFVTIMCVEILMTTCLVITVAVTTESQPWTVGATQVGALGVNGIGWSIVRLPEIGGTMRSTTVQWSGTATALLVAELALIALMLLITFFVQARKKDFI